MAEEAKNTPETTTEEATEEQKQPTTIDMIREIMPIIGKKEAELNKGRDVAVDGKIPFIVTVDNIEKELSPQHIHGLLAFLVENRNPIVIHMLQANHGIIDDLFVDLSKDFELLMTKISKQLVAIGCNVALDELKGESRFGNLIAIGDYENTKGEHLEFSIICDSPDKVMNDFLTYVSVSEQDPHFKDKCDFMEVAAKQQIKLFHKGVYLKNTTVKELVMGPNKKANNEEADNGEADNGEADNE